MEVKGKNVDVKKRIMFHLEDDYYFITYHIIYFLYTLRCDSEKNRFKDYTKLSYIIPFISNENLLHILVQYNNKTLLPSLEERKKLKEIYINSRMRQKLISSIIAALERKEFITLSRNDKSNTIDVWINVEKVGDTFLNNNLFQYEIDNIILFRSIYPKIRTLTCGTLLKQIYENKGVTVWDF
ncbi:hypothetical protein PV433_14340 [Paenibacillus sp. GYB004]|uniref:hypothetical protein n=1 Tax=Paenibacillus sp. GYB004 TaxID=2994393 RepID=UPI002F96AD76